MKIVIHPLFFIFGLYFAFIGKVFLFLTFTITAFLHEFGHCVCALKYGYKMNKISLMPYGAVVSGRFDEISYKDEIYVALSGPMVNLFICVFFVCFWWLVPESYPYTQVIVFSNLSVFAVNLLPAYPLDGGRILSATLSIHFKRKTAMLITRILGIVLSLVLFALFLYSIFNTINISLCFFALFILIGSITKTKQNAYIKIYNNRAISSLSGIKRIKKIAVNEKVLLKTLIANLDCDSFYEITVVHNDGCKNLTINQSEKLLSSYLLYDDVGSIIKGVNFL